MRESAVVIPWAAVAWFVAIATSALTGKVIPVSEKNSTSSAAALQRQEDENHMTVKIVGRQSEA